MEMISFETFLSQEGLDINKVIAYVIHKQLPGQLFENNAKRRLEFYRIFEGDALNINISDLFIWADTKEGHQYWDNICAKWNRYKYKYHYIKLPFPIFDSNITWDFTEKMRNTKYKEFDETII